MENIKKVKSALISVYYKDHLAPIIELLHQHGVTIYSTGGTETFIKEMNVPVIPVETLTSYPSILGGRVKTLHPKVFGGILTRRANPSDQAEIQQFEIPEIDLVIVDLYPFEETVASGASSEEIIEKIDIGGISLIRAAAKNHQDVIIVASRNEYSMLATILTENQGGSSLSMRRAFAKRAFNISSHYDAAIFNYFNQEDPLSVFKQSIQQSSILRYGENPHQNGVFYGDLNQMFDKLNGKELSYNNLVDVDAAIALIGDLPTISFAIIKHTNVCGVAQRDTVFEAWTAALAGDPESAFGGVLVTNGKVDKATAEAIQEIFFEVLIAPAFDAEALTILSAKKNRILLQSKDGMALKPTQQKSILNGILEQGLDTGNYTNWDEVGARPCTAAEKEDLVFGNIICKHLKSNAIALIRNKQLVGKGCGQTSRVDALRHAIEKAKQFNFDLKGATLASDAFFPFNDCVSIAHAEGIEAYIQPGGSVRDKDSIAYCVEHGLAMVMTQLRHFKH